SQWASLEPQKYHSAPYKYDISFIGSANRYRKWFINFLEKKGIHVECFGYGWKNGRVSYEDMELIFLQSKINLNISNSISFDFRFMMSSFRSFLSVVKSYLKYDGKNSSQTKARNFEIPVHGGFQITDYVPTLEEYFKIGKEIVCYNTIDEVEKLIRFYLINDYERECIKEAGTKRAREKHTYKARIKNFMVNIDKIYDK
ncbi:TPA: glycosyltransferase family 1 protein, partial [Vibrio cholerae]|nr:glycosyltransferase family 1 protein [Vibrio cholerae]